MKQLFFYLYLFFSSLLYPAALPVVAVLALKRKYRRSLPARFFLVGNPPFRRDGAWFHVCSFGEARAIEPLLSAVPDTALRMTTTTRTGKSVIETYTPQSRYLPFEPLLWFWMRPQKVLVVFEAELWYLLFALAKRRGAHTMLVNARISDRSFPKYRRFGWLYRRLFACIDEVFAQSEADKRRLEALGAREVRVTGNIKLAALPKPTKAYDKPSKVTVCAASTHEGEEEIALEAFTALKAKHPDAVLLVVPRHPERFEEVAQTCLRKSEKEGWRFSRFTSDGGVDGGDVVLVDAMGELVNCYAISDIVILGGSFVPVGGHNAAEAAQFGCRIVTGRHTFNQRDLFGALENLVETDAEGLLRILPEAMRLPPTRIVGKADIDTVRAAVSRAFRGEA